jgi:hypothetical protein
LAETTQETYGFKVQDSSSFGQSVARRIEREHALCLGRRREALVAAVAFPRPVSSL